MQCGADQPGRDRPPLSVPGLRAGLGGRGESSSRVLLRNRSFSAPPGPTSPIVFADHRDIDAAQSLVLPEKTRLTPRSFFRGARACTTLDDLQHAAISRRWRDRHGMNLTISMIIRCRRSLARGSWDDAPASGAGRRGAGGRCFGQGSSSFWPPGAGCRCILANAGWRPPSGKASGQIANATSREQQKKYATPTPILRTMMSWLSSSSSAYAPRYRCPFAARLIPQECHAKSRAPI
ncbi:hypothetical protein B0T18DRAFT_413604 [Schizothecium vesticola]|uniref:Uncharacterized protein n=1 Tax=Schizothecium vesticola TaxID=314040 RepID=A0AA40ENT7_9PEZI|nr:hypothetical protein B0T18DRAFT_413604 [Schizothecium vesticola]